jgi:hypothetical protein
MLLHRPIGLEMILALLMVPTANLPERAGPSRPPEKRPWIAVRGIYGGVPTQIFDRGRTLADYGVNAIWIGSGSVSRERVEQLKA